MSSSGLITPDDIPSVSTLYRQKKLIPSENSKVTYKPNKTLNDRIGYLKADITTLKIGAIVNAAKESLTGGGGIDGVIHNAAGPELLEECLAFKEEPGTYIRCPTGSARITKAYNLPCKNVIHTPGPIYDSSRDAKMEELLKGCYDSSLKLAADNGCRTIAFPTVSTGIYGYPITKAAPAVLKTVREFLEGPDGDKIDMAIFCMHSPKDIRAYNEWIPIIFPPTEDLATEDKKSEL